MRALPIPSATRRGGVAATTLALGLSLVLTVAPAAAAQTIDPERPPPTPMPAWTQPFSRLADRPTDEPGPIREWLGNPELAGTLAAASETMVGPDWKGLARDTGFLLGYQVVATGVLFFLPEDITGWSDEEKSDVGSNWIENVKNPTLDSDTWIMNYVAHPYWGAIYYTRARERGFNELSSFAYSALASTLYEFGIEAFFEKPSIQDLIVTPVAGALIGAFVFEPIRSRITAKPELAWYDHVGLFLTDPLGVMNGFFERLLGVKSSVRVNLKPAPGVRSADRSGGARERGFGLELSIPWK
jgi:Domain of unknown function (DUF3943)